jgi:hypothetical protein
MGIQFTFDEQRKFEKRANALALVLRDELSKRAESYLGFFRK